MFVNVYYCYFRSFSVYCILYAIFHRLRFGLFEMKSCGMAVNDYIILV